MKTIRELIGEVNERIDKLDKRLKELEKLHEDYYQSKRKHS